MTHPASTLQAHRATAERRLIALDEQIASLRRDRAADAADDEHDPEGMPLSGEWSRLAGLRAAAVVELADVDGALARLDAGTYGVCVSCGRDIPPARLVVRPTALRCVACEAAAR